MTTMGGLWGKGMWCWGLITGPVLWGLVTGPGGEEHATSLLIVSKSPPMFIKTENKELTLTPLRPRLHQQSPVVLQGFLPVLLAPFRSV